MLPVCDLGPTMESRLRFFRDALREEPLWPTKLQKPRAESYYYAGQPSSGLLLVHDALHLAQVLIQFPNRSQNESMKGRTGLERPAQEFGMKLAANVVGVDRRG
jgi:hypothetical protein